MVEEVATAIEDPGAVARPPGRQAGPRAAFHALRHPPFRRFWSAAVVSSTGTWMQNVTVPYVILLITGSATWVGIAAFSGLFPSVVLGPLAGWLADRVDRRRLLLASQSAQGCVALLLWAAWAAGVREPSALVGLLALNGVVHGLAMPTWQAFVTDLVPRRDLLNAVTLNSAQFNAARAVGPALGGLVLARFGPAWAFLGNAVSYAVPVVALLTLRSGPRRTPLGTRGVLRQFAEGVGYARRHPGVVTAVGLVAVVFFLGNPVFQLVPVFAERVYRVGPTGFGLLGAAYGVGAVAGAVVLGTLGDRVRRSSVVVGAVLLFGVGLAGLGLVRTYAAGWVLLSLAGLAFLSLVAVLNTSLQLLVADAVRGRVLALYTMTFTAAYPLGALAQGWVADRIGAPSTVLGSGAALLLVGAAVAVRPAVPRALDKHTHRPVRSPPSPIPAPEALP